MSRRFRVIVNPRSGGGRASVAVRPVIDALRAAGSEVHVVESRDPQHAGAQVAEAAQRDEVVVAAGGDGMLSSLAGAVVEHQVRLGLAPVGRGNDFARMLRVGSRPQEIAHHLLEGDPRPVDVISVGDRLVVGSVYAGVDALASQIVNNHQRLPGLVQYPYAAVTALWRYRPAEFRISVDGSDIVTRAYNVVVANSGYYGRGMHIAPMARIDDGLLDVVVIPAESRVKMIRLFPKVYDGSHLDIPGVRTFSGREVTLSATGTEETAFADGDELGPLPLTARVLPGALPVLLS